jgi:ribonuclease Z
VKTALRFLVVLFVLVVNPALFAQAPSSPSPSRTTVVFLGTGVPFPNPERSGPATAIVVDDRAYLVDAGAGVMRRAAAAARQTPALAPPKIAVAFITHLHSDHTIGLPDLILTGWMMGRRRLQVYGPAGTEAMTGHVLAAWERDIDIRTHDLEQHHALRVSAHDVQPGIVFKDDKVTVTAFPVAHGAWKQAFGYRFQTPDRVIVISGDTSPTDEIVRQCNGCDLLIHEVYPVSAVVPQMPDWKTYSAKYHTSTAQLAALATRAKPHRLAIYHIAGRNPESKDGSFSDEQVLREIAAGYKGDVAVAHDLDIF